MPSTWLQHEIDTGRVNRREFMGFCTTIATMFGLAPGFGSHIAHAVEHKTKPPVIWLEFQDCAGNTESFLRSNRPSVAEVVLDHLSIDYQETIMAAAGFQAEEAKHKTMEEFAGKYIAIVEGSIPTGAGGAYCTIGGRSALQIAREVCDKAAMTIAIGTCAAYGGIPAAAPNPTGALSVKDAVPGLKNLVNLPACPANAANLTAVILYYLTFSRLPPMDRYLRPLFAYGKSIHDNCERRAHYDAGQYVDAWGDEAHRTGYCLFKMGCKGPVTYQNCPVVRWNDGTNWPIGCGHPCVGCAEPDFWDKMTPFYQHLKSFPGFNAHTPIDTVGLGLTAAVGAAFAAHGIGKAVRNAAIKDGPAEAEPGGDE